MKPIKFYRFLQSYAIPENTRIMKNVLPRRFTTNDQKIKCDEELNEYLFATRSCGNILSWFIWSLTDMLFVDLYERYIKDTKQSELADYTISKCTLLSLTHTYYPDLFPVWQIEEETENIPKLLQSDPDTKKSNLILHIKMKLRYNALRSDWTRLA